MKAKLTILPLLAVIASTWLASGGEPARAAGKKVKSPKAKSDSSVVIEKNVQLTGSLIKRDIRRSGRITDGPSQVIVIDRETIERSGATDLRELLTHNGLHR
jgi:hypothetical protein